MTPKEMPDISLWNRYKRGVYYQSTPEIEGFRQEFIRRGIDPDQGSFPGRSSQEMDHA